jgi:predicted N-acetyltransferase YhbS
MDFIDLSATAGMITPSSGGLRTPPLRGEEKPVASTARCSFHGEDAGSHAAPGEGDTFSITAERPEDVTAREALLDRAMGPGRRRKSSEKLRRGRRPSEGLDFVARDVDGRLIGTVRLWDVRAGEGGPAGLLLGPLAVDPAVKSAGIGSALMRHAIAEAARLGHRAILLVGDAAYYRRFGFSSEKTGKLAMPGPYERERFLALELVDGALDGASGVLKASGRKAKPAPMARAA